MRKKEQGDNTELEIAMHILPQVETPTFTPNDFVAQRVYESPESLTDANPYDPSKFAVYAGAARGIAVVKQLVICPVRKPTRQEFVRVHPGSEFRLSAYILELKEERETYLVSPTVAVELPGETRVVSLRLAVNRQSGIFLWPVPELSLDGRENGWWTSVRIAAEKAETNWTRVVANMSQGSYDVFVAPGAIGEPAWPDSSLAQILEIAFGEKFIIRSGDHPVIRRLLGLS